MNYDQKVVLLLAALAILMISMAMVGLDYESNELRECDSLGGTLVKTVDGYHCLPIKPILGNPNDNCN
jgi:hypothetical protein